MKWYIIRVKAGQEIKLAKGLSRGEDSYRTYVPTTSIRKEIDGEIKTTVKPAVSGYVFVKEQKGRTYLDFLRASNSFTRDASVWRDLNGDIALVSDDEIRLMKLATGSTEEFVEFVDSSVIKSGQAVLITKGKFKGYEAVVSRKAKKRYVVVELKESKISAVLNLPLDCVQKIDLDILPQSNIKLNQIP